MVLTEILEVGDLSANMKADLLLPPLCLSRCRQAQPDIQLLAVLQCMLTQPCPSTKSVPLICMLRSEAPLTLRSWPCSPWDTRCTARLTQRRP